MRLWSLHPQYLDPQGLVALWREGLLAQKVLMGETKGYKNHPQLIRFKSHVHPLKAIANYLHGVCDDAVSRNYSFNRSKIHLKFTEQLSLINVTLGQAEYEREHLQNKLLIRNPDLLKIVKGIKVLKIHPSFLLIRGGIADWERVN